MAIKATVPGLLIYAAMLACLAAAVAFHLRSQGMGRLLFRIGFLAGVLAFAARWLQAGHAPMQSLFEVFLSLAVLVYPLSLFWRRRLGAQGEATDALINFVVLFPAGFIFHAEPQPLPPALQCGLFVPHVAAYLIAYVVLIKASLVALRRLAQNDAEEAASGEAVHRLVRMGFPLLTAGLLLGAWWGKLAWGDYWNWDPKELWSLATWLVYLGYLHLRALGGRWRGRAASALALAGGVCVGLTLLWVNLAARVFPGLHTYAAGAP